MVVLEKLTDYLETLAPAALAEDYDNVGLLVGDRLARVNRVLVCLDTDSRIAAEAVERGCELIISHHPLLFHPARNVLKDDSLGNTLIELIRANLNLYAYHTNLDAAAGGLCDYLLERIGITDICHSLTDENRSEGIGRVAMLDKAITLGDFMEQVKNAMGLSRLRYVGDPDELVKTVGVTGGGGGDMVYDAARMGCDVYISGDFKHHHGRYAHENNLALIELTHYDAEIIFCDWMAERLSGQFDVEIVKSRTEENVWKTVG